MADQRVDAEGLDWPVGARPVVRVAGQFPLETRGYAAVHRSRSHALHLHDYWGTIDQDGRRSALEPGTLTVSPADEPSSYDLPAAGVHWCIHFTMGEGDSKGGGGEAVLRLPRVRALGPLQGEAAMRFAQVARLHGLAGVGGTGGMPGTGGKLGMEGMAEAASVALQALLVWVGTLDAGAGPSPRGGKATITGKPLDGLLEFIDRNLGTRLSAETLAEVAGWSQNYLARRFRERTGMTIPRYVLTRRVALARLLLETTNLPVKEVGRRVGLGDPHHFNKQFRAVTGVSPSACRGR